jgi:hypothetical protein
MHCGTPPVAGTRVGHEVAAFIAGQQSFQTIFTGPLKDNEGKVRIAGKP